MENPAFGFGTITWWGFSPALDLQTLGTLKDSEGLHILLIGAGDLRHVLQTIARRYRHTKRKLNFYIVENNYELLARHLLLLSLALEPERRVGLQDKTEIFLELFGNVLVREQVMEYVQAMADVLIRTITDLDFAADLMPWLRLDALKFKERDFLEAIVKFWRSKQTETFDGAQCWDLRLRQHLQQRYDAVPNIFDWDFTMKLSERGAEVIGGRTYARWRHKGVAFELRDATYDVSNRTLASGMAGKDAEGNRVARRGYFGDILVSPFLPFGVQSENKALLEKKNGVYARDGAAVSEFNVLSLFYELGAQRQYEPGQEWADATAAASAAAAASSCSIEEVDEETSPEAAPSKPEAGDVGGTLGSPLDLPYEPLAMEDVSVSLLSMSAVQDMPKKGKYQRLFSHVFFSNSTVHLMDTEKEGLAKILAEECLLLAESALYMLELKMEQVQLYASKVSGMAKALGFEASGHHNPNKDTIFVFERS